VGQTLFLRRKVSLGINGPDLPHLYLILASIGLAYEGHCTMPEGHLPSYLTQEPSSSARSDFRMPAANVEMTSRDIVTDPYLQSVLNASSQARQQCINLIDLVEVNAVAAEERPPLKVQLELSKQQKLLYAYLAQLRGLNRNAITKVRNTKQTTSEARQEIDRLHLQLQNLYYEERHLRGEIAACESYEYEFSL